MKPGSTTTSQKTIKRAKNGAIPPHQNQNIPHTTICGKGYADSLLGWTRGNFGALHALGEHCAMYADLLKNHPHPAIKYKQHGLLSTGVLLQHDNARPHTARSTVATIQDLSFKCLPHPPYSPDLAPWFSCLWTTQRGDGRQAFQVRWRGAAGGAQVAALSAKRLFSRGIHAIPKRWNACMERNGDYVEKWCHCVPYVFNKLRDKKYLRFSFDSPSYYSHPHIAPLFTWIFLHCTNIYISKHYVQYIKIPR